MIDDLLRPLSARSIIASTLLGTHPPRLSGRLLVALGQEFGIPPGTLRVALSRMVDRNELTNEDGTYALTGLLLVRQERQVRSRQPTRPWDGLWEGAIVTASARTATERAQLRRALVTLGLGERREGVWMRPDNLDPMRFTAARRVADEQVEWYRMAPMDPRGGRMLADHLFTLPAWAEEALALIDRISTAAVELDTAETPTRGETLTQAFILDAAARRLFVRDPLLPDALIPDDWPAQELRAAFEELDRRLSVALRAFFKSVH